MTYNNVPDDWHTYYRICEYCGTEYHLSEGCECLEETQDILKKEEEERDSKDVTKTD